MTKFEKNDQMQKIRKVLKPYQEDPALPLPEKIKDTEAVYQALSTEGKTTTELSCVAQLFRKNGFIVRPEGPGWQIAL